MVGLPPIVGEEPQFIRGRDGLFRPKLKAFETMARIMGWVVAAEVPTIFSATNQDEKAGDRDSFLHIKF